MRKRLKMNTKYKLLKNDYEELPNGRRVYRIEALRDIGADVKAGDKGGYVESEENLSTVGSAWVSGSAWVCDSAWVCGSAG